MKTVLNNLSSHISYEHDGRLVHTDKKTGVQMVSIYTWPSLRGAREALANAFGKIQWQKFNESPRAPFKNGAARLTVLHRQLKRPTSH